MFRDSVLKWNSKHSIRTARVMTEIPRLKDYNRGCFRALLIAGLITGAIVWGILSLDDTPQNADMDDEEDTFFEE